MRKAFVEIAKSLMVLIIMVLPLQIRSQTINDVILTFNAGAELVNSGSFEGAIAKFEECISMATKLGAEGDEMRTNAQNQIPNLHYRIAVDKYKAEDIDGAIKKFEETIVACEKYSNNEIKTKAMNYIPQLYYSKGNACVKNEDYNGAITNFDKAIELVPDYAKAYYGKGLVYKKTGEEEKMVDILNKTIETAAKSGDTKTGAAASKALRDLYFAKAAQAVKEENYETAFAMFAKTLEYDSSYPDPYYYMAVIYNKQLEYDKSLENANKALELETDTTKQPKIYFELGNAYIGIVEYEKACEAFSRCLVEPFAEKAKYKMENVLNCK
jgi:tetratricopeptide (TPR) repeat protein